MAGFDAINAAYPSERLLDLPLWKWCSLVEQFCWANTDEKDRGKLERHLEHPVDWVWIRAGAAEGKSLKDPARWQTNKPGESLLSVHRGSG